MKEEITRARQVMTKNVITVKPDTSVYDAIDLLVEKKVSGLPVVNDQMEPVGVISEKDLMKILITTIWGSKDKVEDYMSKEVVCFDADDNVVGICEFFLENAFRRAPITEDGKLVGVISRRDILKLIADIKKGK